MLGVEIHTTGSLAAVKAAIKRTRPEVLQRECFGPFQRWVRDIRILGMFRHQGRVSGEDGQMGWPALSKWTLASKGVGQFASGRGARGNTAAPMQTAEERMAHSYRTDVAKTGAASWRFGLDNYARSTSKWSPGFDYPSALHRGWGPYTVRPRAGGPGFLAWPMRRGTILTGGRAGTGETMGRVTRRMSKKGSTRIVSGDWARAMETHPKGAPPRPHIRWFHVDTAALGLIVKGFVFRGIKSDPPVTP
jgi:hypothetical protein